jgi:hypothetical protein
MATTSFAATLNALLSITGNGVNDQSQPIGAVFTNATSPGVRTVMSWAGGDNIIVPPQSPLAAAQLFIAQVPFGVVLKFKGVAGDTGYTLGTNGYLMVPVGTVSGPGSYVGSFIINASGACQTLAWWI